MQKKNKKRIIHTVLWWSLLALTLVYTTRDARAQAGCPEDLIRAEILSDNGEYEKAILLIEPCVETGKMTHDQKVKAYDLLLRLYLATNSPNDTEAALRERMNLTPCYQPDSVVHPPSIVDLARSISEESLGIFSETAPGCLLPDVHTFIGTFSGGGASFIEFVADSLERNEGAISMKSTLSVRASAGGYAGWFIGWGNADLVANESYTRDMTDYAEGSLVFSAKSRINLEVGIRSGNVSPGRETSKVLLKGYPSFAPDNKWHQVCIPLSVLEGRGSKADLSRIKVLFVVASNTPSGGTEGRSQSFWIDDVRWEKSLNCD